MLLLLRQNLLDLRKPGRVRRHLIGLAPVETVARGLSLVAEAGGASCRVVEPEAAAVEVIDAVATAPTIEAKPGRASVVVYALPVVTVASSPASSAWMPGAASVAVDMPTRRVDAAYAALGVSCGSSSVKRKWYVSAVSRADVATPWGLGNAR